jgi:hypothetical protein
MATTSFIGRKHAVTVDSVIGRGFVISDEESQGGHVGYHQVFVQDFRDYAMRVLMVLGWDAMALI